MRGDHQISCEADQRQIDLRIEQAQAAQEPQIFGRLMPPSIPSFEPPF